MIIPYNILGELGVLVLIAFEEVCRWGGCKRVEQLEKHNISPYAPVKRHVYAQHDRHVCACIYLHLSKADMMRPFHVHPWEAKAAKKDLPNHIPHWGLVPSTYRRGSSEARR